MLKLPLALATLVLILLAFFLYREHVSPRTVLLPNTYQNGNYQIVFSYPDGYILSEHGLNEVDSGGHYSITLVRADAKPVENGEGPTGISIDLYPYTGALLDWVRGEKVSNFALGDGRYTVSKVGSANTVNYHWSGLYEGETTAFKRGGYIVAVSKTELTPGEHAEAYEAVLNSLGQ